MRNSNIKADLNYLLDLREQTEKEMSTICNKMVDLPTKGYDGSVDILHDAYQAAKARLDRINDHIADRHAHLQQFGE